MSRIIDPRVQAESRIPYGLSGQQISVLRASADGRTHLAVAQDLGISLQTVKNHLSKAFYRLNVRNMAHAIAFLDDNAPGWRPRMTDRRRLMDRRRVA